MVNNVALKLSLTKANKYIKILKNDISKTYGIMVTNDNNMYSGSGYIKDGVDGDFSIYVTSKMRIDGNLFNKKVYDVDFLKCICSLYHERTHVIQGCDTYYDAYPDEDIIKMTMRKFASNKNRMYYYKHNRYNNDLSEIEAESTAILHTYEFIKDNFLQVNADKMISKMVNEKIETSDYFISGHFTKLDDILNAFDDCYENAKYEQIQDYSVFAFHKNDDECIWYLQYCARDYINNQPLIDKFNNTTEPYEKDMLISSITHHLHPEIDYERVYPCLKNIDLSPEEVFGRSLPDVPEGFVEQISKDRLYNRILIADRIHSKIQSEKYNEHQHINQKDEALNESLLTEQKQNSEDIYGI